MDNEGTGEGIGTGAGTGQEGLWRAQLPADLKENETFTPYKTIGDFAKKHLETVGNVKDLEGKVVKMTELEAKLSGAIFKPDEKATPEQREAYYRTLGKPEKATEYEFPKTDGIEHDPKMVEWAQSAFHAANLSKEQAQSIGAAWDGFMAGMVKAEQEAKAAAILETETKLKTEWAGEYDKNAELAKRAFKKFANQELGVFLEKSGLGNAPLLTKVFAAIGKAIGEDESLPGELHKETPPASDGLNYTSMDQFKK